MPALRRLPVTIFYHRKMLLTPFIDTNNNQCAEFCLFSSQSTVDAVNLVAGQSRYSCVHTCFSRETVLADSPFRVRAIVKKCSYTGSCSLLQIRSQNESLLRYEACFSDHSSDTRQGPVPVNGQAIKRLPDSILWPG